MTHYGALVGTFCYVHMHLIYFLIYEEKTCQFNTMTEVPTKRANLQSKHAQGAISPLNTSQQCSQVGSLRG